MEIYIRILTYVTLIFILIALFPIFDMYGFDIKLFSYSKKKRQRTKKQILDTIDEFYDEYRNHLISGTKEYIDYTLSEIGLTKSQSRQALSLIRAY